MGLISGSGSFTRYQVKGRPAENFMEGLADKIGHNAFRNLTEDSTRERSTGLGQCHGHVRQPLPGA